MEVEEERGLSASLTAEDLRQCDWGEDHGLLPRFLIFRFD